MFGKRKAAKELALRDAAVKQFVDTLINDDGTFTRESELDAYMQEHGIPMDGLPQEVRYELRLAYAAGGAFAKVETTLLLKDDETALVEEPAGLLKEVARREFRGGTRGISIPLGHGVRYRTGAVRGHVETIGTEWQVADTGTLTVTDQRIVYHGGRKTLEFQFSKLAALQAYSDAIDLGVTNRQATSSFRVMNPPVMVGLIRAAFELHRSGMEPTILINA